MKISNVECKALARILEESQRMISHRMGYSLCEIEDVDCEELSDVLTVTPFLTKTAYLMARAHTDAVTLFVHFTNSKGENFNRILENGFYTYLETPNSDYSPNALCCFRVDSMSRPFKTAAIDTAILFDYTGEYKTCVRQLDGTSNIGYQILETRDGISNIRSMPFEQFEKIKSESDYNAKSVLRHHGLTATPQRLRELKGTPYQALSTVVANMFKKGV